MPRAVRAILLVIALIGSAMVPATADSANQAAVNSTQGQGTDNFRHVDNIVFPDSRSAGSRATDSDFVEFTAPADWVPPGDGETGIIEVPEGYAYPAPGETRVLNLMGTYNRGLYVTDVTDPEDATLVAHWDCGILQADVFVFNQGEGEDARTYAAYTLDATANAVQDSECAATLIDEPGGYQPGQKGTFIADVTDPYRPQTVSFLPMAKGSHQTTVHPSGDYVYNSAAVVAANRERLGSIEVYDVSDPENPSLVDELMLTTGLDSHDMTFSEDGDRLFVAALTHSFIIDTSDPSKPTVVSRIFDPAVNIHHDAHRVTVETPAGDRDYLLLGDELGGAISAGFCPGGGIHVYDITGPLEMAPVKVGAFFIPDVRLTQVDTGGIRTCTAHVIQPIPGTTLLSVAWYNAGVRVLDYSGLADLGPAGLSVGAGDQTLTPGIQEVGHHRFLDSNLWSAKIHQVEQDGSYYIFGGDTRRTLDIWHFTPDGAGAAGSDRGTWLDVDGALARASVLRPGSTLADGYEPFCLLPDRA